MVCVLFFIEVFQLKSSGFDSLAAAIHITLLALFSTRNFLSKSERRPGLETPQKKAIHFQMDLSKGCHHKSIPIKT